MKHTAHIVIRVDNDYFALARSNTDSFRHADKLHGRFWQQWRELRDVLHGTCSNYTATAICTGVQLN